jgi:uncharacterized protein (TIGR01777 family)
MRIIVAGGSGFIGRHLISALVADGHTVTVLTRAHRKSRMTSQGLLHYVHWNPRTLESSLVEVLAGADAVINLAGANIGSRRWTKRRKAELLNSRVCATETLVRTIECLEASRRPRTLVNASGVGFYGNRCNEVLTEGSESGDTFLARVCERWEQAATAAQSLGVRVVLIRTAVVLATDSLTLHLMAWPFRLFLGGPIGDGQQWFPWIHIDDLVSLYDWALSTPSLTGPVNAVAPDARTQAQIALALGAVLLRPHRLRVPVATLRLLMGEQADLLLHGCQAVPEQALAHGYVFRFPELMPALRDCLQHDATRRVTPLESRSPFFPVLSGVVNDLPEVLRDQYLVRFEDPYRVVLEGTMDRIWHRPFWLWPFLRLLAIFDILFPEQGNDIEASMVVEGQPGRQGGGAQTWHRAFRFNKLRRFNATMVFDQRLARVVERLEPFGILEVVWNVTFEPPDTIRIGTEDIRAGVDRCRMVLPRWVSVEVEVSETALLDRNGTIAVAFVIRQPWLGEIFGYTGRFQVRKEEKKSRES